jgi:tRNA threonylcarbamoyl adenosine modification protein (Sua5/YciO/YrdC/YwlC family)
VVDAAAPDAADRVAEVLGAGGLAVLPTETVYGLAALASDATATGLLFDRKGRAPDVPVAVLCADAEQALALADAPPERARELAVAHWPGPLTMVLRRRADLGWALGEPTATIGVRCPDHDLVRAVARRIGPLATTSANRHGQPTPPSARRAAAQLLGPVDLVVDGGTLGGTPSTVVELTGVAPRILRQGAVVIA